MAGTSSFVLRQEAVEKFDGVIMYEIVVMPYYKLVNSLSVPLYFRQKGAEDWLHVEENLSGDQTGGEVRGLPQHYYYYPSTTTTTPALSMELLLQHYVNV